MFSTLCTAAILLVQASAADLRLSTALTSETPINAISTTPSGRTFLTYARIDGSQGPTLVEYVNGSCIPYPSSEWNSWTQNKSFSNSFIRLNAQRIGPDGKLYVVDTGSPAFGQPVIPGGARLLQIDIQSNKVTRSYDLTNATYPLSLLDDVRFNGPMAYLTDAGIGGIIVLDRTSGKTRRILNGTASTVGTMPVSGEGKFLNSPTGGLFYGTADQLEVSPDGKYLYYQPVSGGMHRIQTRYLNDTSLSDKQLETYVQPFAPTPCTAGTAIDAHGNIYSSDTNSQRIWKITPQGTMSIFVEDPRLLWVDAMWVDSHNRLWMPAVQLNRGLPFTKGKNEIQTPLSVFIMDIGVGPSPIDHA